MPNTATATLTRLACGSCDTGHWQATDPFQPWNATTATCDTCGHVASIRDDFDLDADERIAFQNDGYLIVVATDTHGNTRESQQQRAAHAVREANDQIAGAYYDGADTYAPEDMAEARAEWEVARDYRNVIADADLRGIYEATPTTYADLAVEAAGRAHDAASRALNA